MFETIIIISVWIIFYCIITKVDEVKRRIKLFLRIRFNDFDEKIWAVLVSLFYILFPAISLFFVPLGFFEDYSHFSIVLISAGIIGFFASVTISSIAFDWGVALKNLSYEQMNSVNWIRQVKKISPLFGVGAALAEEFFFRFLIPLWIYKTSGTYSYFVISLLITSAIFTALQVFYASTPVQRFVKFIASISISGISILLIIATHNIIPSLIMHGVYVFIFFLKGKETEYGGNRLDSR